MTFSTSLRNHLKKILKRQWTFTTTNSRYPGTQRKQFAIFDAPSELYKAKPYGAQTSTKLNDLVALYTNAIQEYFADSPNAQRFILMFDSETPIAKYINAKVDVQPTPLSEIHEGNHRAAWKDHFSTFADKKNTQLEYMLNYIAQPTDSTPTPFDYTIPDNWYNLLGNRAYKEEITSMICNGVFHFTRLPPGKQLIVIGPDGGRQRTGNKIEPLDEKYDFKKYEADFAVSYLSRLFPEEDCVIFSIDGDVLVNVTYFREVDLLSYENRSFANNIFVVSKTDRKSSEYVDINEFWIAIEEYMGGVVNKRGESVVYPTQTFCILCILCCNHDYVEGFPGIGPVSLFEGFKRVIDNGTTRFISGPLSQTRLKLNAAALFQLMLGSYLAANKTLHYPQSNNVVELLKAIVPHVRKRYPNHADRITIPNVRTTFANLLWTLKYIIASGLGEPHDPATACNSSGESLYGFSSDYLLTPQATYVVVRPDNTVLNDSDFRNPF